MVFVFWHQSGTFDPQALFRSSSSCGTSSPFAAKNLFCLLELRFSLFLCIDPVAAAVALLTLLFHQHSFQGHRLAATRNWAAYKHKLSETSTEMVHMSQQAAVTICSFCWISLNCVTFFFKANRNSPKVVNSPHEHSHRFLYRTVHCVFTFHLYISSHFQKCVGKNC